MDEAVNQYRWVGQMLEVMRAMHDTCAQNKEWRGCKMCPFEDYCDVIQDAHMNIPQEWNIEDD